MKDNIALYILQCNKEELLNADSSIKDWETITALDIAIERMEQLKELKEAYESDYQIDDLIQVCVKLWG